MATITPVIQSGGKPFSLPVNFWKKKLIQVGVCSRATGAKGLAGTACAARRSLCDLLGGLPAVEMGDLANRGRRDLDCSSFEVFTAYEKKQDPKICFPGLVNLSGLQCHSN